MPPPQFLDEFTDDVRNKFLAWLTQRGGTQLEPVSEWEVLRVTVRDGVGVVQRSKLGMLRWNPQATVSWGVYQDTPTDPAYRVIKRGSRPRDGARRREIIGALLIRDGWNCGLCGREMAEGAHTIEHFVPVTLGGKTVIHNMILTHEKCNRRLAALNIRAKIELIVLERSRASAQRKRACNTRQGTENDEQHGGRLAAPEDTPPGARPGEDTGI